MEKKGVHSSVLKNSILKRGWFFILLLIAICLVLHPVRIRQIVIEPFTATICGQAAWLIRLGGVDAHSHHTALWGAGFSVDVKDGCNAIYEIGIFVCAVFAYPSTLRHKFLGIAGGSSVIYALNMVRVVSLFLIGVYHRSLFKMVHDHVSQGLFIFFVVILWIFWASSKPEQETSDN